MQEDPVPSLGREDPLQKEMATPVFLSGESHGQRSLVGYSSWGLKESDMTEELPLLLFHKAIRLENKPLYVPNFASKNEFTSEIILWELTGAG